MKYLNVNKKNSKQKQHINPAILNIELLYNNSWFIWYMVLNVNLNNISVIL